MGLLAETIPFFERAIELDPGFARAYASLGSTYASLGETGKAELNLTKAFELRDRVTERESFTFSATYHHLVTRNLHKALETYELFTTTYPADSTAWNNLAALYHSLGQIEKCYVAAREAIRLSLYHAPPYYHAAMACLCLNRLKEAKSILADALAHKCESPYIHNVLQLVAFHENDAEGMELHARWSQGSPEEYQSLQLKAQIAAFRGKLQHARELTRLALDVVNRANLRDAAARLVAEAALREVALGNCWPMSEQDLSSYGIAQSRNSVLTLALVRALCGENAQAQELADSARQRYPSNTNIIELGRPLVMAAIEMNLGHPRRAQELLESVRRYETCGPRWSVYIRGHAYLKLGDGKAAGREFQRILNQPLPSPANHLYPLAHLGAARAAVISGETAAARQAYGKFFALWKDADRDIPVLRQARADSAAVVK